MHRFANHLRHLLVTAMILVAASATHGQVFNVYNVNTSGFPKITADYVALDAMANPIENLTAADFRVTETPNGGTPVDLTATLQHRCKDMSTDPQATILIVMDRSFSMNDQVSGKRRWDYARDAVKAFVRNVRYVGETRVSVVSFASNYELWVPWTNNPQHVSDTLDKREPSGGTNYRAPFRTDIGGNVFDLLKERPSNLPRFIFWLTDGHPNPGFGSDAEGLRWADSVSKECQANNVRFYSVTILEPTTHYTLEYISRATGGKSIVTDEGKVVSLLSYLALDTQVKKVCTLEWTSPFACGEASRDRTAVITLRKDANPTSTVRYTTPPTSVAKVSIDNPVLYCGDPPANGTSQATVTITATQAPFVFTGFVVQPNTNYFRIIDYNYPNNQQTAPAQIVLQPGQKRTFAIEFKQGALRQFRSAQLVLEGTPCPQLVSLVGGTGQIILNSPVGGELYSTCDTVVIKWAGVLPTDNVMIEYSEDDGATWNSITTTARGLAYKWLPPRPGQRYRIRVTYSPVPGYAWATQLGGAGAETANSISVSQDELRVYTAGWFDGPSKFGTQVVANTAGNVDGYMCEMDGDGNVLKTTLLTGNGSNDEKVIGAHVDPNGFVFVAGHFESAAAQFGSLGLALQGTNDTKNGFVFKLSPLGNQLNSAQLGGTSVSRSTVEVTDFGLQTAANGTIEVYVVGRYQRFVRAGSDRTGTPIQLGPTTSPNWIQFYAIYDENLVPKFITNGPRPGGPNYVTKTVTRGTWTYETGSYTGPKTFGTLKTLPNAGQTDAFVSKFGAPQTSTKASDSSFRVLSPSIVFNPNQVAMNPIVQGSTTSSSFSGILCNTGAFDIVLNDPSFGGANPGDFRLVGSLRGVTLRKGECIGIEIAFTPQGTGPRSALLSVTGACNTLAQLQISGEGLAPCAWTLTSPVDVGVVVKGQSGTLTNVQILRNDGPNPLNGNLQYMSGSPDITITRGLGNFSIPSGGFHTIDISFTPSAAGKVQRIINFNLPAECGAAVGLINAEGVDPVITVDSVDFGQRRLLTVNIDTIYVTNRTTLPARITNITVVDPTNPHLTFTVPGTPLTLQPDQAQPIPVRYVPQDRNAHSVDVRVTVEGDATPKIGNARGSGFLPAIEVTGYTFGPWNVGQRSPEQGRVTIRNTDASSPLTIYAIDLPGAQADFVWTTPLPQLPITIAPNASRTFDVSFSPQAQGNRSVQVCVDHDAKPGPDDIPPYARTCADVIGVGTVPSALDPIAFGSVLTCATKTDNTTIVIQNQHPTATLNISNIIATGDVSAFTLGITAPQSIPPQTSARVTVTFVPPSVGTFSAAYELVNDQGLDLNINVSGSGITAPISADFGTIPTGNIGQQVGVPINVNIGSVDTVSVRSVNLTMTFPAKLMRFAKFDAPQQAGWTFTPDVSVAGRLGITATGSTNLTNGTLVTPYFDVFLNADSSLPVQIDITTPYSCLIPTGDVSRVTMKLICYARGRLVSFGANAFALDPPRPNPVLDVATVPYSTGIEVETVFELIDNMGNVVKRIETPRLPSAAYELTLDVADVAAGVYYLRMTSGPYASSVPVTVVR